MTKLSHQALVRSFVYGIQFVRATWKELSFKMSSCISIIEVYSNHNYNVGLSAHTVYDLKLKS